MTRGGDTSRKAITDAATASIRSSHCGLSNGMKTGGTTLLSYGANDGRKKMGSEPITITTNNPQIVQLINDLIDNAVHHGADYGGSYESNYEGLIASAQNLLDALKLDERYGIKKLPIWHDGWTDIVVSEKGDRR